MSRINVFDMIRYDSKTHPHDVIYNTAMPEYSVYFENVYEDAEHDTLRELVESQGCNWFWYCEYYDRNPLDEKWGRYDN